MSDAELWLLIQQKMSIARADKWLSIVYETCDALSKHISVLSERTINPANATNQVYQAYISSLAPKSDVVAFMRCTAKRRKSRRSTGVDQPSHQLRKSRYLNFRHHASSQLHSAALHYLFLHLCWLGVDFVCRVRRRSSTQPRHLHTSPWTCLSSYMTAKQKSPWWGSTCGYLARLSHKAIRTTKVCEKSKILTSHRLAGHASPGTTRLSAIILLLQLEGVLSCQLEVI
jgi:hypothetical protein